MRTGSHNKSRKKSASNTEETEVNRRHCSHSRGRISVVGIGPGSMEHMTPKARVEIENADVVVGYKTYVELVRNLIRPSAEVVCGSMGREVERARTAVVRALENKAVVVVSSGDPGVYGMAGVILEVTAAQGASVPVEVVPGVTAATAAAAKLGAPLVSDFAVISLSDLLTPWELIEKRLKAAAEADFSIVLYNPQSVSRKEPLIRAYEILLKYRDLNTPVGVVRQAGRAGETVVVTTLRKLLDCEVDMLTTIIVGSSKTKVVGGRLVTPRGYNLNG